MSKLLTEEEMMLVGGGCLIPFFFSGPRSSRGNRGKENRNSSEAKAVRRSENRNSQC